MKRVYKSKEEPELLRQYRLHNPRKPGSISAVAAAGAINRCGKQFCVTSTAFAPIVR